MKKTLKRRTVLKGAAAGAMALGFPAVVRGAKPYDGKILSVFSYAGPFEQTLKDHIIKPFEEMTGARVKLDVGWWDMLPRLKASPPGEPVYDVVITDPTQGFPSIKEGLFQKYDPANVPNAGNIYQSLQDNWIQKEGWGVNVGATYMTLAFNSEMLSDIPQHWHDVTRPDLAGEITMYDAWYMSLFAFAQIKAGLEGKPGEGRAELEKSLDDVLAFSKENRDLVRVWWSSSGDFIAKTLQQEVAGGICHSAIAFGAEDKGEPIVSVIPSEGTAAVHLMWMIPEGTKEKRLAEEWMNHYYSPESQVLWGINAKMPVANLEAAAMAGERDAFYKRFLPITEADWEAIVYYPYDIYHAGDNFNKISDFWDREVLRKS